MQMRGDSAASVSTRRAVLAQAASGLAAGTLLSAVPHDIASAAPATSNPVTQLLVQVNNQGVPWNKTTQALDQDFIDQNFNANNKGIRVTVDVAGSGGAQAQLAAAIAGSGFADIYEGCCDDIATLQSAGWIVPLDSYLKTDNIATSIWSPGHIAGLTFSGQLFGLPSYDGPAVLAYRQDILDDLGLDYPDPSWTAQAAASLWQSCTGKDGKGNARHGVDVIFDEAATTWQYWLKGWGVDVMDAAHDRCTADVPAGAAALQYLVDLHGAGVMESGSGVANLVSGAAAFSMCGGWNVFDEAMQLGDRFKWDLLPMPTWPKGRSTFGNVDFYALNRASTAPDAAWQVLKWLTAAPDWQRFQMSTTLVQPCLLSLWSEWETIVKQVAPPLAGKALHWYQDAALGYAYSTLHFDYAATQANAIADQWLDDIWNGQVSPAAGLRQLAGQVNALETIAAREASASTAIAAQFPSRGPAMGQALPGI